MHIDVRKEFAKEEEEEKIAVARKEKEEEGGKEKKKKRRIESYSLLATRFFLSFCIKVPFLLYNTVVLH